MVVYGRDPLLDGKKARQEIPPVVSNNCYVTGGIVGAWIIAASTVSTPPVLSMEAKLSAESQVKP